MNSWIITEALTSIRRLRQVIDQMSEEEVLATLKLELDSQRRASIVRLLQTRATKLYQASLTK